MTVIGYMRVSTPHQKFDSQQKALKDYGVEIVYKEHESGRKEARTELNNALSALQPGDTFVIFKLDRLARSTKQLLSILEGFEKQNIHFVSIQNDIDTSTPMGKFFFTVMSAFSEMEAALIRERVLAGLDAARDNGTTLGRPSRTKEIDEAIKLYVNTDFSVKKISQICHISVPTIYNHLQRENIPRRKSYRERH
ncbi:recombinase family protein [Vagococcus sp. BWB3-3]|uniref:Recombinase family protein n=1 Tax=Vagococcus allomyrinae TaxID=2794353 RepID=A0A940ST14_9ENTE|nr:recombinase family protein [Vagococcus allomyrinae]MBP1042612.1 recombinase family protein [Vagococcus allomyrinae]